MIHTHTHTHTHINILDPVPGGTKNPPAKAGDIKDLGSIPGSGRFPAAGNGNPVLFWPGESHGLYSPWGHRVMAPHSSTLAWKIPWTEGPGGLQSMASLGVKTRLSDFTFTFHFHALEKEVATHSSVLAWRIPGTGEPDGLPSMGLHRVGHD